jgi:branched-chain amino acid transport system permease protein
MRREVASQLRQLGTATRQAAHDARRGWSLTAGLAVAALAVAVAAPLVVTDVARRSEMAAGLYVVLAAVGLNFAVGMAGMPSLGQGAFVAIGAFGAALLEVKAGWDPTAAILVATAAAVAAGIMVGAAAVRAETVFIAVGTWVVAWLVAFALSAFPGLTGGSQGLPLREAKLGISSLALTVRFTPAVHWEVAVVLVAISLAAFALLRRAPFGVGLAAARDHPAGAEALGIDPPAHRLRAFVVSALLGGLSGALAVHLIGVADTSTYGPLLSVELFVAVLLGGEGTVLGPIAGATVLVIVPRAASGVGRLAGVSPERFQPVIAGLLLVVAVIVGRGGVVRLTSELWNRLMVRYRTGEAADEGGGKMPEDSGSGEPDAQDGSRQGWPAALEAWQPAAPRGDDPLLQVEGASKSFGGVTALRGVSIDIRAGRIHAIIGPNGSGKTTLLRALGGTTQLDAGSITLDGLEVGALSVPARVQAGVVRTLQEVSSFARLRVADGVAAGAVVRRRYGGALRSAVATPLARSEGREVGDQVRALLELAGLAGTEDRLPETLSAADHRFLGFAAACASFPRVLLLDEPAAALQLPEMRRLAGVLESLRARGVAVVVVEHNLRFVRMVADVVTVLDAGEVISAGSVQEVADDPAVAEAYLGPARL